MKLFVGWAFHGAWFEFGAVSVPSADVWRHLLLFMLGVYALGEGLVEALLQLVVAHHQHVLLVAGHQAHLQ